MYENKIKNLQAKSTKLYLNYRSGIITLDEYLKQLQPLDKEIDRIEITSFKVYLQGIFVSEKASLKLSH